MAAYWLVIMAVGLAIALALWIILVLRADRKTPDKPQASLPPREIIGGQFQASRGGRQLMPDPTEPIVHSSGDSGPQRQIRERPIPGQRKEGASQRSMSQRSPSQHRGSPGHV